MGKIKAGNMGKIIIAGIGPGSQQDITPAVLEAVRGADAIVGYKYYFQFIEPYVKEGCECIDTGMKKERERAEQAFLLAEQGKTVVVISSGDAGIYGMAPLIFEMRVQREQSGACSNSADSRLNSSEAQMQHERTATTPDVSPSNVTATVPGASSSGVTATVPGGSPSGVTATVPDGSPSGIASITIDVLPGISAFQKAASLLGAPIGHDLCIISLSDLMTPWEQIERRIKAAAVGDFVTAIYNPKSHGRYWQLYRLQELFLQERSADTPVGYVRQAGREDQAIRVTTLGAFDPEDVDMFTVILIGNSQSYIANGKIITPRGYYRDSVLSDSLTGGNSVLSDSFAE